MKVKLVGDLTDDQRAHLMKVANHCPVHQTMTSETLVKVDPAE